MNKLFTSIAVASLSLTMAVGVGVAVNQSAKSAQKVEASTNYVYAGKTGSYDFWRYSTAANGGTAPTDTRLYAKNQITLTSDTKTFDSVVFNLKINANKNGVFPTGATSTSGTVSGYPSSAGTGSFTVTPASSCSSFTVTVGGTAGNWEISSFDVTLSGGSSATVSSVSISGDMTSKSYSTVQEWSNAGLTASVSMSDSSQYAGTISWSYTPETPAAYVISNEDEVSNGTVNVKATAADKYDDVDITGINVTYATVAQGLAATPASGTLSNVIVKGIISQITEVSVANGNATYFISDDGLTTSDQLEVYRGKGLNGASFTNVNDIRVGDIVVVYGSLTTYNSVKEFTQNSRLLSLDRPASDTPIISITETDFYTSVGDANVTLHETHENLPSGGSIAWSSGTTSVATIVSSTGVLTAVAKGHSVITVSMFDSNDVLLTSSSINVTVLERTVTAGDAIYITAEYNSTTYYLSALGGDSSSGTDAANKVVLTVQDGATSGTYALKNGTSYLTCTSSSPYLGSTGSKTVSSSWIIGNDGTNDILISTSESGRHLLWNYNNGTPRFGCYNNTSATILNVSITKTEAPSISGLVSEGRYRISATRNGVTYYLKDNGTSSAPSAVTNFYEATIFAFELVDTDTYEISNGANHLYSTTSNNGIRLGSTVDTWVISEGVTGKTGDYCLYSNNGTRYLTLYNAQDWRGYTDATISNRQENTDLEAFTAAQFATEFMGTYTDTCDSTGATPVDTSTLMWSTAASQFAELSSADQNTLKNASANNAGSIVEQTASRYDVIIAKYGSETINDFMGRGSAQGLAFNNLLANMNSESTIAVIIVVALSSVTAIGAIFFIKRRKYN